MAIKTSEEEANAKFEETDLVFRTLAHFLRRVPGYLEKHHLICRYRQILVEHANKSLISASQPLKCLTHGELYERNLLFKQTRRSKSDSQSRRQMSVEFAAGDADEDELFECEAEAKALSNVDISAILTDWKNARISSPSADLTFFFLSSTSQSMREKYTQDWLEQYYFSFTECLRSKFNIKLSNEFPEFDFDVFCKDFKAHIYKAYLQAVLTLTRELRFVENEFHYLKENQERERMGFSLKCLGRRLLELVDELINILESREWKRDNLQHVKSLKCKEESVNATISVN